MYYACPSSFTTVPVGTPPWCVARPSFHSGMDLQSKFRWLDIIFRHLCKWLWGGWGGLSPLRMSSKPMDSSLPRSVSRARFELGKNGRRWIWKEEGATPREEWLTNCHQGGEPMEELGGGLLGHGACVTCLAALYSICSFSGAWRPWMFLSVDKFILSWFGRNCTTETDKHIEYPSNDN